MAPAGLSIPDAPKHLTAKAKKQWEDAFVKGLKQAAIDCPESESAQRTVATKEANKMLAVPAPESADEIDGLDDWQVILRETRVTKDGSQMRHCVTSDGRKYSHPVKAKKEKTPAA